MKQLRIVMVDDEPLALERLGVLLERIAGVDLVGRADGCETGVPMIARLNPDLVLLDIRMRDGTAFDLLDRLPSDVVPLVVLVTAFPRYACRAFEIGALDYLLKPVQVGQLALMVERAISRRNQLTAAQRGVELERVIEQLRDDNDGLAEKPAYDREIWVRQRGSDHVRVPVSDIDWIGVEADYVCLHVGEAVHMLRSSLDRLAVSLDPAEFVRIHRGTIVRRDRVSKVRLKRLGVREAVLHNGTTLPIGRINARNLPWT